MATWSTPKTDWEKTDHYDYSVFNRLNNNIVCVEEEKQRLFGGDVGIQRTYTPYSVPHADDFNQIENRVNNANIASYGFDIGNKKTYSANNPVMDYEELNRIESALDRMHTQNQININILPKLSFRLGNMRGVKV